MVCRQLSVYAWVRMCVEGGGGSFQTEKQKGIHILFQQLHHPQL